MNPIRAVVRKHVVMFFLATSVASPAAAVQHFFPDFPGTLSPGVTLTGLGAFHQENDFFVYHWQLLVAADTPAVIQLQGLGGTPPGDLAMSLYSFGPDPLAGQALGALPLTLGPVSLLTPASGGPDHYDLNVKGYGSGAFDYQVQVTAVPEPRTWAMLLGGLGLLGLAARRRSRASAG